MFTLNGSTRKHRRVCWTSVCFHVFGGWWEVELTLALALAEVFLTLSSFKMHTDQHLITPNNPNRAVIPLDRVVYDGWSDLTVGMSVFLQSLARWWLPDRNRIVFVFVGFVGWERVCGVDQCAFFASVLMSWCVKTVTDEIADVQRW